MRCSIGRRVAGVVALILGVLPAAGQERLVRKVGDPSGLPTPRVLRVRQDSTGFLWIGSETGLVRYDGVAMRRWAPDVLHNAIFQMAAGPTGDLFVIDAVSSIVYRTTPSGVEPVAGPEGTPLRADRIGVDARGRVCATSEAGLLRSTANGWQRWSPEDVGGQRPSVVAATPGGGLLVAVGGSVWRLGADGDLDRITDLGFSIEALLATDERRFVALQWEGAVWRYDGTTARRLSPNLSRGISLVQRGEALWAGLARQIVRIGPDESIEILDVADGVHEGGDLLVDREGALWAATFNGLFHFPEPDTLVITEREGLPSTHTRYVVSAGDGVWVGTWQGQAFLPEGSGMARPLRPYGVQQLCVDRDGSLWSAGCSDASNCEATFRIAHRRGGRVREQPIGNGRFRCAGASGAGAWLSVGLDVLRGEADGSAKPVASVRLGDVGIRGLMEDRNGTLWVVGGESVCSARASEAGEMPWSCEEVEGADTVHDIREVSGGEIWIGTQDRGVLRRAHGSWEPVLPLEMLHSRTVTRVVASPRGGAWILGPGNLVRLDRQGDRWMPAETLSAWNGVPASSAEDLLEGQDGSLWVASWGGLVRVPPPARGHPEAPPPVALIDVRVDGRSVPVTEELHLPFQRNRVELHFAAMSFRDPARLTYRVRLGPDRAWAASDRPVFRYVDLPPGAYRAEVAASLDGDLWSAVPAAFAFRVEPPWYRQAWAIGLFAIAAAGLIYAVHRARVAHLMGLERQRIRIAMDLHDEMGSGLGSIGMLAAVAADGAVPEEKRRSIALQIADTAENLGASLTEIVRALRPGAGRLDALAAHLAERAGRLFPGDHPRLSIVYPSPVPRTPVSLAVRRNLLLIGSEALHNAARHAAAGRVVLGLEPAGRRWRLWVEDDGRGISSAGQEVPAGLGLDSMRKRAEEIGAAIQWLPGPGGGTRVDVSFPLRPPARRTRGRLP